MPECREHGCAVTRIYLGNRCREHHMEWFRAQTEPDAPKRQPTPRRDPVAHTGTPCAVPDCQRPTGTRTLCTAHYQRARRFGLTDQTLVDIVSADHCGNHACENTPSQIDHNTRCCRMIVGRACGYCARGYLCSTCNLALAILERGTNPAGLSPRILGGLNDYLTHWREHPREAP